MWVRDCPWLEQVSSPKNLIHKSEQNSGRNSISITFQLYIVEKAAEHQVLIIRLELLFRKDFIQSSIPTKLYILSTLNTDYLLWHTQLIVCAVKY